MTVGVRRKTAQGLAIGTTVIGVASIAMAIGGEFETMLAWWMATALLVLPLLSALYTPYVALKTICLLTFITQFVTLPVFYIDRDDFAWGHVKPFGFTAMEAWPILAKVLLFLACLIVFFKLLYRFRFFGGACLPHSGRFQLSVEQSKMTAFLAKNANSLKSRQRTWIYFVIIILVISVMIPLNLWMFSRGISIVGVEPPELPYRLSGILHYLSKFIIPMLLGYLYWKTRRGFFPMALLLGYALILGLSSVSRSVLIMVMLPVLALAWLDRRRWLLAIAGLGTVIGYASVTLARSFVHLVVGERTVTLTDGGMVPILHTMLTDPESHLVEFNFLWRNLIGIFGRIDGFENLVMAQYYDPNGVVGPLGFLLRMIWRPFAPIDLDLHHVQWQGNLLPEGFVNGGALLSNAVILGNASPLWIVGSAMVTACAMVVLEKSTFRVVARYGLPDLLASGIIGLLSIFFFIESGGASVFVVPFLLLLIASCLPPLCRFDRPKHRRMSVI